LEPQTNGAVPDLRCTHASVEASDGVDVLGHTRQELLGRFQRLGSRGHSRMTKAELAGAIARRQD